MCIDKIVIIGHIDAIAPEVFDNRLFGDHLVFIGDKIDQEIVFLFGQIGPAVGAFDDLFLQVQRQLIEDDPDSFLRTISGG